MQSRSFVRLPFGTRVRVPALLLALTIAPSVAHAQVISNPSSIRFQASADQTTLDSSGEPLVGGYSLQVFQFGGTLPLRTLDLGKPNPDADGAITADISSLSSDATLQGQTLEAQIVAFGPDGSATSVASNAFVFGTVSSPTPTPAPVPNSLPTVQLLSPTSGSVYASATPITLSASASDSDGSIVRVDFYAGSTLIGSATAPDGTGNYTTAWNAGPGNYSVTAVATDNSGGQTQSAAATISVKRKLHR